jgi:hypothetical protein
MGCHVEQGLAFLALFKVGGEFLAFKIIRETTEIKIHFLNLLKLSIKFGSL